MPVRYTGSDTILNTISSTLVSILGKTATETTAKDAGDKLDDMLTELKKTRVGHEQYLWGEEIELDEEEIDK